MSKIAEEAALKAIPNHPSDVIEKLNIQRRRFFSMGYEQAVSDVLSLIDSNMTLGPGDTSELKSEFKAHFL